MELFFLKHGNGKRTATANQLLPIADLRNQSTYNELTDSPNAMRRIVSPSNSATLSWRILLQFLAASDNGSCRSRPVRRAATRSDSGSPAPTAPDACSTRRRLRAPFFFSAAARRAERASGIDDIVDEHAGLAFYVADDVHHRGFVRTRTALVDDREIGVVEPLGNRARARHAAHIGADHDQIVRRRCNARYPPAAPAKSIHCPQVYRKTPGSDPHAGRP